MRHEERTGSRGLNIALELPSTSFAAHILLILGLKALMGILQYVRIYCTV